MGTRALLIVDMQVAVVADAWQPDTLVDRLNGVLRRAREHGVPVILVQHSDPAGPLATGAPGWALRSDLDTRPGDHCLVKSATDAFYRTELAAMLADWGVTTVTIGGAATDYCVDASVRAAQSRGFDVDLLADGHTTDNDRSGLTAPRIIAHHNEILADAIHPGGRVRLVPCASALT